ncbi:DUF2642 domain-containing protein [Priestia megaterium]|uniref:DUF2642 domain-containing protein n=1 Tax=Priestia megaterium TaxID=1404 RepID=UPI00046EE892|nr:DUF2642 domain-containing protein [Priestia megaterium]
MALIYGNSTNSNIISANANLPVTGENPCNCNTSNDLKNYLLTLQSRRVRITTSSEEFSGILLAVKLDYIVLAENQGSLVLIPISKIRTVAEN